MRSQPQDAVAFTGSWLVDHRLEDDPLVSIEEGVERFVAWFREHKQRLR